MQDFLAFAGVTRFPNLITFDDSGIISIPATAAHLPFAIDHSSLSFFPQHLFHGTFLFATELLT
jgi:hypothetical protein